MEFAFPGMCGAIAPFQGRRPARPATHLDAGAVHHLVLDPDAFQVPMLPRVLTWIKVPPFGMWKIKNR
jgi:hypothetical protein